MQAAAAETARQRAATKQRLADRLGIDLEAVIAFQFPGGKRIEVCVGEIFEGLSAGWLLGVLPDADSEAIAVPQETPLQGPGQIAAFQVLLESMQPPQEPVHKAFAGRFHLLPYAFLVAHRLGLEASLSEIRALFLRDPAAVFRELRLKKDGPALREAFALGLSLSRVPHRQGVAEQVKAADEILKWGEGSEALASVREILENSPMRLFHLFHIAHVLHAKEPLRLLRSGAGARGTLREAVRCAVHSWADSLPEAMRAAVRQGVDRESGIKVLHVAAELGHLQLVQLALAEGQAVNLVTRERGESPVMLAAAFNHVDVLRCLIRAKGDLSARSKIGLSARGYAARQRHKEALRLIDDPFAQLATV